MIKNDEELRVTLNRITKFQEQVSAREPQKPIPGTIMPQCPALLPRLTACNWRSGSISQSIQPN